MTQWAIKEKKAELAELLQAREYAGPEGTLKEDLEKLASRFKKNTLKVRYIYEATPLEFISDEFHACEVVLENGRVVRKFLTIVPEDA